MAFKMKGFSPFTAKTADLEVAGIERKQKRIDRKAAKGKDVSGKQSRLDKESERIYDREIKRAERKERKADKKEEYAQANTSKLGISRRMAEKAATRKRRKASKIREAVSPLKKGPKNRKGKSDYDPKTKTRSSRWIYGEEGIIPDFFQGGKKKSRRVKVNPKTPTHHGSSVNWDGSPVSTTGSLLGKFKKKKKK